MDGKFSFEVLHKDAGTNARRGVLHTAHGDVATPVFMPVGTAGAVKAMPAEWLDALEGVLATEGTTTLATGEEAKAVVMSVDLLRMLSSVLLPLLGTPGRGSG